MDCVEMLHDTTRPYKVLDYKGIEYTVCNSYSHISRYRRLRQVIHYLEGTDRFISLEIQNSYQYTGIEYEYYTVTIDRENRLDLIANDYFGTPMYSWVISYINGIDDGFTVHEGQSLMIPTSLNGLYRSGSVLSSIPVTSLNLGTE